MQWHPWPCPASQLHVEISHLLGDQPVVAHIDRVFAPSRKKSRTLPVAMFQPKQFLCVWMVSFASPSALRLSMELRFVKRDTVTCLLAYAEPLQFSEAFVTCG